MSRPRIFTYEQDKVLRANYGPRGAAWCARELGFTLEQIYGRAKRLGVMGTHAAPRSGAGRVSPNAPPSYDHRALARALGMPTEPPPAPGDNIERHYVGR